ncbi:MAG: hypothetical protein C4330_14010 [Chitinophagaceae bacterium]
MTGTIILGFDKLSLTAYIDSADDIHLVMSLCFLHGVCTNGYMFRRFSSRVKRIWVRAALLSVEMAIVLGLFVAALVAFIVITRRIFV